MQESTFEVWRTSINRCTIGYWIIINILLKESLTQEQILINQLIFLPLVLKNWLIWIPVILFQQGLSAVVNILHFNKACWYCCMKLEFSLAAACFYFDDQSKTIIFYCINHYYSLVLFLYFSVLPKKKNGHRSCKKWYHVITSIF